MYPKCLFLPCYWIGYRESWNLTGIGIDDYISGIMTSLVTPSLFPRCTTTLDFRVPPPAKSHFNPWLQVGGKICIFDSGVNCPFKMVLISGQTDPKGRHDAVLGDSLHETRSSRQTLKPRPACGEEGANHDHPWWRPSQRANHQIPVDSFSEP